MLNKKRGLSILLIFFTFEMSLISDTIKENSHKHFKPIPDYIKLEKNMIIIEREDTNYKCDFQLKNCEEYDYINQKWNKKDFLQFKDKLKQLFIDSKENIDF
jgi:hypothetical protein